MTLSVNGPDIADIVRIAATVSTILMMVVGGWFVYLMVRPSRRARDQGRETDPAEAEQLWRIVNLMERRLEVLERALADQVGKRREQDFLLADEGRDSGRME
jgi:hypothetical protein